MKPGDSLTEILEAVFVWGVGSQADDIKHSDKSYLNLQKHAVKEATQSLQSHIDKLLVEARINENSRHNETCHNETTAFDATEHKLGSSDFIERISELRGKL